MCSVVVVVVVVGVAGAVPGGFGPHEKKPYTTAEREDNHAILQKTNLNIV